MRCSLAAALFVYCLSVAAAERLSGSGRTRTTRTVYPERLPYGSKPRWPRSLPGEDSGGLNASSGPRSELYRLDRGLTLALVPDSRHLSPTLVTLRFGEDSLPDGRTLVPDTEDLGHCYYAGHVLGQRDSRAVVSLCDGMTGYIQTATQGLLTIEPVRRDDGVRDKDGSRSPHLLTLHQVGPDVDAAPSFPASSRNATTGATWRGAIESNEIPWQGLRRPPRSRRRRKRSYSLEQHVEVLVAADSKMARYHGKNLKHYILTLMAAVAHIYKDPSIGNLLDIAVVKLIFMEEEEDNEIISPSASSTLKNFCRWQQKHNHLDDSHPYHHDTAILLTREDLCRLPKTCDTLGLAQSGMICDPHSSCSIVEDNGLSAAFTIAHELGHVLNIPHDDDQKCSKYRAASQPLHVMARMLDYNSRPWSWSECSRHYITTFLDAGYGQCLRDSPAENLLLPEDVAPSSRASTQPGELFDMDRQCELVFGRGAKICPYMPVCKRLWCTVHSNLQGGCRTQHMPWADGTTCGKRHWCQKGECVAVMDQGSRRKVDGDWGPWQGYGRCSRTCGGGIQSARRECDSPRPAFGGKYCVGERVRYRSCNTEPCPAGSMDFREEQCSAFNGKTFNFPDVPLNAKWTAHYSGISHVDTCKLYCRVVGMSAYYLLKEKVIDGTACNPESFDVCINGVCKSAGCDHQLNSTATTDMCGVCRGDNATCRTITGDFSRAKYRAEFGYNFVAKIPAGASFVDVRQFGFEKDDNYLALKSAEDEYLLNGNFTVSMFRKTLRYGGTIIEYSGSNASIERINATKPLGKELHLMVLTVGKVESPDIRYEYTVSIRDDQQYVWELSPQWTECSRPCQGHRYRQAHCKRRLDGMRVEEARCHPGSRPQPLAEVCNLHCTLRWKVGEKSECSARCGTGVRTLKVQCVQQTDGQPQERVVADALCEPEKAKPPETEKCGRPCHSFRWVYDDWAPCSKTCGGGEQVRTATCVGENQEAHPDSQCDASTRSVKRPCNQADCPRWEVGQWTECSVTCGSGLRRRPLWCQQEKVLAEHFCHPAPRPVDAEPCEMAPCETADWHVGKEAPCPVSCGGGVTQRNVTCRSSSGAVVDSVHCRGSPQPPTTVDCNLAPCPPPQRQPSPVPPPERTNGVTSASLPFPEQATQSASSTYAVWRSAPWSQCSVSCGSGLIKRQVSCVHEVTGALLPNEDCNGRGPKPVTAEACDGGPCGHWQHGDWGACSVSCGQGIATRRVRCLASSPSQEHLPDDRCEESSRPRSEQACQVPCGAGGIMSDGASAMHHPSGNFVEGPYKWRIGLWGTCSKSCGGGVQRRQVVCVDNLDSKSHACNPQLRPPETQHCNTDECPVWAMGEWTQCDQECGGGHQTRQVACQGRMGLPLMDAHCPQPRPESRRSCNSHSCASPLLSHRWHSGSWSPCSVTCGTGVMKRKIECLDSSHNAAPYIKCEGDPPEHAKTCTMEECPKWQLSPWSPCTAPCGNGTQKRVARCMKRGQEVSPLNCHGKRPSPQVRTCNLRPCHYRWKKKRWTPCSATCGGGSQTRTVVCVDRSERLAPERFCNSQRRPKVVRHCAVHPCPFIWKTSDWSECSQTCGEGFQKRAVTCHKVNPYGWADPVPLADAERRHGDAWPHERRAAHYCTPHDRPATTRPCMVGHCGDGVFWRPGPWTPCSTSCGPGKQKRRLRCHDNRGKRVNNSHCSAALKHRIKRKRRCMLRPCSAVSCEEVQRRGGVHTDGEQQLNIRGRQVKVYCARMNTSSPKEYISLDSGESNNYSEVYGKRWVQALLLQRNQPVSLSP
ncbi:putative thrombospondin-like protein [Ixodes scapularis]